MFHPPTPRRPGGILLLGDVRVDLASGTIRKPDGAEQLRPHEHALLLRLYAEAGETVTRARLFTDVWGYAAATASRTLDTTVARLRGSIEADPAHPRYLLTVHGIGYVLARPAPGFEAPLVGRAALIERIGLWIRNNPGGWLTLAGPGGIGKSRLLAATAALPRAGMELVHLDLAHEGIEALTHVLRRSPGPRLVLADLGALPADAVDAALVAEPKPHTVVLAARAALDHAGEAVLVVPPLDDRVRAELLQRADLSPAQVDAVAAASAGLPLALDLARNASSPDDDAAAWLLSLEAPDPRPPRHRTLTANLRSTLGGLSPAAREALQALPTQPTDDALVDELSRAGVVEWVGPTLTRAACLLGAVDEP